MFLCFSKITFSTFLPDRFSAFTEVFRQASRLWTRSGRSIASKKFLTTVPCAICSGQIQKTHKAGVSVLEEQGKLKLSMFWSDIKNTVIPHLTTNHVPKAKPFKMSLGLTELWVYDQAMTRLNMKVFIVSKVFLFEFLTTNTSQYRSWLVTSDVGLRDIIIVNKKFIFVFPFTLSNKKECRDPNIAYSRHRNLNYKCCCYHTLIYLY